MIFARVDAKNWQRKKNMLNHKWFVRNLLLSKNPRIKNWIWFGCSKGRISCTSSVRFFLWRVIQYKTAGACLYSVTFFQPSEHTNNIPGMRINFSWLAPLMLVFWLIDKWFSNASTGYVPLLTSLKEHLRLCGFRCGRHHHFPSVFSFFSPVLWLKAPAKRPFYEFYLHLQWVSDDFSKVGLKVRRISGNVHKNFSSST